jgi:uncharacterized protein (TIGR00661 family)
MKRHAQVDVLVSGKHGELALPFNVKFQRPGLGFFFGTKGGVDVWRSITRNNIPGAIRDIRNLPVEKYDLVLNDFEPLSAWSCLFKKVPCIGLSHQGAVIHEKAPRPAKVDRFGIFVLRNYAPVQESFGFHFASFAPNIFTPVIRKEIREARPVNKGHYTVYLPAYSDKRIIELLRKISFVHWEVFSKHSKTAYRIDNVQIEPIHNEKFVNSLINCEGFLSGAGFEAPAETLYLGKKLLVIPMSNQYEQKCNAAALQHIGVPVIEALHEKNIHKLHEFVQSDQRVSVNYLDNTEEILVRMLDNVRHADLNMHYHYAAKYFDYANRKLRPTTLFNQMIRYFRQFPI